jgi:DNA-binding MarR family transcriptional regulator
VATDLLGEMSRQLVQLTRRSVRPEPGALLEPSAFRILSALIEHRQVTAGQLGAFLRLDKSTVSRQVKSCVTRGLVEREVNTTGRGRVLVPTPDGHAAYRHDRTIHAAGFEAVIDTVGRDRLIALVATLSDLNNALDVVERDDAPDPSGPRAS